MTNPLATLSTIVFFLLFSSSYSCNVHDQEALIAFKSSFRSPDFPGWTEDTDCCSWHHVGCDDATGRVTSLRFSDSSEADSPPFVGLDGSIPPSIGDLPALRVVVFRGLPSLVGPIPPELAKLKELRYLTITRTKVSGPVPPFLSRLASLRVLNLGDNALMGDIPSSLGSLPNLAKVGLYRNQLSGGIPSSLFAGLSQGLLADLDLSENRLTGPIPRSFVDVQFASINLHGNQMTKPFDSLFLAENKLASFDRSSHVFDHTRKYSL
ncbi:polygalacturonase inhibitor-like [Iris pallida]|uniref:Polygalacturonase inhibitor-like n=1 Tax=Iris pallida TaxID=29817 RepID=A0AAX6GB41_IRIPA|nr:polygalacturonase inhibitor-like [Iris pallida]